MNYKSDDLDINMADLKRRNSTPCIKIGTDQRVNLLLFSLKNRDQIKLHQVLFIIQILDLSY